jgi:hypothetical protein
MLGDNIGILFVLLVQRAELPSDREVLLIVDELNGFSEDGDLLDEVLKRLDMDRESRVLRLLLSVGLLSFLEVSNPDVDDLLKLRANKVAE